MERLEWLEILGFRSFSEVQRLDFSGDLALIWGPNSQGKTSIAEAIEFLFTGGTVRRELLGGAKAEFHDCLRNAHLPDGAPVRVSAGIRGDDGAVHEVVRTLARDYAADADCESTLTIDGTTAEDLSSLGVVLSEPPLRAPVLLQHSLRFALSARPQDRSNYFKSVLEIHDLEALRDLVEASAMSLQVSPAPAVTKLRTLRRSTKLGSFAATIETGPLDRIADELADAVRSVLSSDAGITTEADAVLPALVDALSAALAGTRERSFPVSSYALSGSVPEAIETPDLKAIAQLTTASAAVGLETARLSKVFEAVLAVPAVADASVGVDCPVCESPGAITPARVAAIRDQVAATVGLRKAEIAARAELGALVQRLEAMATAARSLCPESATLSAEILGNHAAVVGELLGDAALHRALTPLASELHNSATALEDAAKDAASSVTTPMSTIGSGASIDGAAISGLVSALEPLRLRVASAHEAYAVAAQALLEPLGEAIDKTQGTEDSGALVALAGDVQTLRSGLADERARAEVRKDVERALKEIDKAKSKVFDEKFDSMSDEINVWWQLLRPDEAVRFASVRRRGTGRRFVMFKAHLLGAPGLAAIERDALGVFSDSQLNALGLAAFLARTHLQATPLIVLDDPLQAGDEEHRATFVGYVLAKLLELGIQVIVLTYDDMTSKLIHHRYESLPVVGFSVSLERPADGSVVIRTTNTAEALLQRAKAYLESDDPEFRSSAAGHLRKAAERIAKEIIVAGRTAKVDSCSLADYEEKTLGLLITELTPYLTRADDPGKWKMVGDLLNPGNHDDAPPTKQDLKMAFGYLRAALRDYIRIPVPAASATT